MTAQLLASPLPKAANLDGARAVAAPLFEADVVPGGDAPVFVALPWGPVAVFASGQVRQAEVVASGAGRWVRAL